MLTRAINWVARLSIDPRADIRRGTIAVFSELQSAYTSQRTLHELYFHQHDDKKLLEERVRGTMSDMGERLTRVAVNPTGGVTQKRHNIAVELQSIATLVEEMLTMAKQSYSAALTASHMGHLAFEHAHTDYRAAEATNCYPAERNQILGDAIFERLNRCHDPRGGKCRVGKSQFRSFRPHARSSRTPTEANRNTRWSFDQRGVRVTFNGASRCTAKRTGTLGPPRFAGNLFQAHRRTSRTTHEQQRTVERFSSNYRCDARRIDRVDLTAIKSFIRTRPQRRQRISECRTDQSQ
jgi:hypothetical protein